MEGRGRRETGAEGGNTGGALNPGSVYPRLRRIAEIAKAKPGEVFTSLVHLVNVELLRDSHRLLSRRASPGVDGVTAREYERDLEGNIRGLHERLRAGKYRAQPVRRIYIPKGDGTRRPIGIPAYEDKIVQRAVATVMEAVYEADFLGCSYGFRPGRKAHEALEEVWRHAMGRRVNWVLDTDIEGLFDNIDWTWLREFIRRRIRDGGILRLVGKWLHAGVLEEGRRKEPEAGTPQGGVISPLLANIYLHNVIDLWVEGEVRKRARGEVKLVRYADDLVILFEHREDAEWVGRELRERLAEYKLRLKEEKTRLIPYGRKVWEDWQGGRGPKPPTFDFLGFTHVCGADRKGWYVVKRFTARKRLKRVLRVLTEWCRRNRHREVSVQARELGLRLRGHYNYYGITGNGRQLQRVAYFVTLAWWKWLSRRSQRGRLSWEAFSDLLRRNPLPKARVVHSVYACG